MHCKLGENYPLNDHLSNYHDGYVLSVGNWQAIYQKRQLYHCNWKFKAGYFYSYFDLSQVALDSSDKLTINGTASGGQTEQLFTFNGPTSPSGLLNLAGYDYISVSLEVAPPTDSSLALDSLIFSVVYYEDELIPLQHHTGQLTIPLNAMQKSI